MREEWTMQVNSRILYKLIFKIGGNNIDFNKFMIEFLKVSTQNPPQNKKELSEFWAKEKSIQSKSIENFTISLQI